MAQCSEHHHGIGGTLDSKVPCSATLVGGSYYWYLPAAHLLYNKSLTKGIDLRNTIFILKKGKQKGTQTNTEYQVGKDVLSKCS